MFNIIYRLHSTGEIFMFLYKIMFMFDLLSYLQTNCNRSNDWNVLYMEYIIFTYAYLYGLICVCNVTHDDVDDDDDVWMKHFLAIVFGGWGGFWFMFMEVVGFDFFFLLIRAFDDLPTYRLILWIIGVSINSKLFDLCEDLIFEWDFSATDTSRISAMLLGF